MQFAAKQEERERQKIHERRIAVPILTPFIRGQIISKYCHLFSQQVEPNN